MIPGMRRGHRHKPLSVVFVAYEGMNAIDLSGPLEVFATATRLLRESGKTHPGYALTIVAAKPGAIVTSSGLHVLPHATIAEHRSRGVDTLFVVGGFGSREAAKVPALLQWLRRTAPGARRYGSVCTGAFVLAAAGLLDGRRVATHWNAARELADKHPQVRVDPAPIFVKDGNVFTSAGVSAGIDLALSLVEDDLGSEIALAIAKYMVLYLRRPGDQSQYSAPLRLQQSSTRSMRDLISWAAEHPSDDLSVPVLARRAALSPRQLSRVFKSELGVSPAHAVEALRIEAAQRTLCASRHSLEEVAGRSGFPSADVMRRTFLRVLKVTPSDYRARFGLEGVAAMDRAS
jgi:transcriptional regulator GlxA family with amidase domain